MKFKKRVSRFPTRRLLYKIDKQGNRLEDPTIVEIVRDSEVEGVIVEGTPISADELNKGNWRDDNSVSFFAQSNNDRPLATIEDDDTVKVTATQDGKVWLVPPKGGKPVDLTKETGGGGQTSFSQSQMDAIDSGITAGMVSQIGQVNPAVQAALNTRQPTLINGQNIRTINGQSLLGSGNINIQGGEGGGAVCSGGVDVITVSPFAGGGISVNKDSNAELLLGVASYVVIIEGLNNSEGMRVSGHLRITREISNALAHLMGGSPEEVWPHIAQMLDALDGQGTLDLSGGWPEELEDVMNVFEMIQMLDMMLPYLISGTMEFGYSAQLHDGQAGILVKPVGRAISKGASTMLIPRVDRIYDFLGEN